MKYILSFLFVFLTGFVAQSQNIETKPYIYKTIRIWNINPENPPKITLSLQEKVPRSCFRSEITKTLPMYVRLAPADFINKYYTRRKYVVEIDAGSCPTGPGSQEKVEVTLVSEELQLEMPSVEPEYAELNTMLDIILPPEVELNIKH